MPTAPRFALACFLAAACSSSADVQNTPTQDAGGEVPFVGDGSVDTPYAFACNSFPGSPNLVSLVEQPAGTPPPPAAGGQILSGTYYLTAGLSYERPSSCTRLDTGLLAVAYRFAPATATSGSVDQVLRGATFDGLRFSGRYSTNGTSFSDMQTCPPTARDGGSEDSVPYTATETEFRLYDVSADCGTEILVLTKQ